MLHHCNYEFPSPVGWLYLLADEAGLRCVAPSGTVPVEGTEGKTPLIQEAICQLEEYFSGKRKNFTLPLAPRGTPFQRSVWLALAEIPYGSTRSYKDIAVCVGCPKGFQAVGQANSRNPLPFLLPCHRVIASDGSPGGYSLGSELKSWLLELEQTYL